MTTLYADAVRLKLEAGNELEAFVRIESKRSARPKCLLLHGNPGSLMDWQQLIPLLAQTVDLAAIDLPGFGRSRRSGLGPESLSLERLAEQAIAAANSLGWRDPLFVVGHSHGGGVAQVLAARYPERIAGLALIGTLAAPVHLNYRLLSMPGAASLVQVVARMFRSQRLTSLKRAVVRRVTSNLFSPEPVPAETLEHELALLSAHPEILVSMVHVTLGRPCATLWQTAPAIRCPTLFLHGSEDAVVPAKYARSVHDRILNAGGRSQFQLLPGAGHMLHNYQATELAHRIRHGLLPPSGERPSGRAGLRNHE